MSHLCKEPNNKMQGKKSTSNGLKGEYETENTAV